MDCIRILEKVSLTASTSIVDVLMKTRAGKIFAIPLSVIVELPLKSRVAKRAIDGVTLMVEELTMLMTWNDPVLPITVMVLLLTIAIATE